MTRSLLKNIHDILRNNWSFFILFFIIASKLSYYIILLINFHMFIAQSHYIKSLIPDYALTKQSVAIFT